MHTMAAARDPLGGVHTRTWKGQTYERRRFGESNRAAVVRLLQQYMIITEYL